MINIANVIVYSTQVCPYCVLVKKFLKENSIEFKDIDVSKDKMAAKEMIEKSGQMGVPTILIDNEIVVGFDKEKLKKILHI